MSATASYATANTLLRDDNFRAGPMPAPTPRLGRLLAAAIDPRALGPNDPPSLIAIGGPQHTRLRWLVSHAFTPRALAALSTRVEQVAHELLDVISTGRARSFDLVDSYAAMLPVTVIAEILGVPATMRRQVLRWGDHAALALEPGLPWRAYRRAHAASRHRCSAPASSA